MSYTDTFIQISGDCPVYKSEIPLSKTAKKPVHVIQYELLSKNPYRFDHQQLIFEVYIAQKNIMPAERKQDEKKIWDALFAKEHPCLRSSALTKRYGFGAHYDSNGKIAIYPMESMAYKRFTSDKNIKQLSGMKTVK